MFWAPSEKTVGAGHPLKKKETKNIKKENDILRGILERSNDYSDTLNLRKNLCFCGR